LSEPDANGTKNDQPDNVADIPRDLDEPMRQDRPKEAAKPRPKIEPEDLFNHDSLINQVETQVSLLTSAMSQNMLLATGAYPALSQGPGEEEAQKNVWLRPKAGPARNGWADARSLHLRDAARLSFATASLISAYTKLKGPAAQRFTTRHTIIPDPAGRKKPRRITTVTHHLIALPDEKSEPDRATAHATQQG
jgi:hypothetical protein